MYTTFEEKKKHLLDVLHMLALRHNRDYYVSMIPVVEMTWPDEEDVIDMYLEAIEQDSLDLLQSRKAFVTVERFNSLI